MSNINNSHMGKLEKRLYKVLTLTENDNIELKELIEEKNQTIEFKNQTIEHLKKNN